MPKIRFGEYLVQKQIITQEQLNKALLIQKEDTLEGYHRMIGFVLLNEYKLFSKDGLYDLLKEWENGKD